MQRHITAVERDPIQQEEELLAELEALRRENGILKETLQRRNNYIHDKINHLLNVMGTKPLREEELDDDSIQDFDPLGIIFDSFRHILASLKEKNSQLQLLHDETMAIFAAAQVGIMVVDPEFRILSSNDRMREIFFGEVSADEICGDHCRDMVCKGQVPDEFCAVRKILSGAETASFKGWEVRGHVFDVEAAPIRDSEGNVERIVLVYNDITGLKKAQDELGQMNAELEMRVMERTAQFQEVNKELESFCYSISHDLRAPLRHISGFSNILLEEYCERLDDEGQTFLRRICAVTSRMGRMIDDLLRISRVSRATMTRSKVNLSHLAENIANLFQEAEPERSVRFDIAPGMVAQGDATLLGMVLQNLIGNAWKYSAKNRDAVIQVGKSVINGRETFFVRDNGVGFDMAYLDKLFRVFERLHGEEFEGSGIGLATVQRIIHRHRGEIWAEGEVDKGATFYFTLQNVDQQNQVGQ
ncbi:MAG TPA: ATP-binding protein [Geobacteraceae bacterium]|nr:ATP-binding protein [Geobacteraceae bacterium]